MFGTARFQSCTQRSLALP